MRSNIPSRRGSALLIVLGLLAFLMISAVAFSISMRTERSAAAAYRRNLMARELLSTAFADARATLDYALEVQREEAGFSRNDAATRTVEALAPFKYPGEDRYGRLIASRNSDAFDATSVSDDPVAYLLDSKVLAHVPPYVAYPVYMALEQQQQVLNEGANPLGEGSRYNIDWSAGWKPIKAKIPKMTVDVAVAGNTVLESVVGRMAWAVVNLSDSLDINAIGSASTCRGLGLTASEFAFGITDPAKVTEAYELLKENRNTVDGTELALQTFCSNADLAQYAASSGGEELTIESDGISPFSWQDAIANEEDGFYSPFSVYSFWPKSERKKEDGARASSDSEETTLACNDLDEGATADPSSGTGLELANAVKQALGSDSGAGDNLVLLLHDYLDADSVPSDANAEGPESLWANAMPTVERVPMLSEVAYDAQGWGEGETLVTAIAKAFTEAFKGQEPKLNGAVTRIEDIPSHFGDQTINIELPAFSQTIGLRSYFPGGKTATGNFTFSPEGFAGVYAVATQGNKKLKMEKDVVKGPLSVGGSLEVDGGSEAIFRSTGSQPNIPMNTGKFTLAFKGTELPVANLDKSSPDDAEEMQVNLLVDFFFRVPCKQGSQVVDLCPSARSGAERGEGNLPSTLANRMSVSEISKLDAQYFRITRPVTITFTLQWKIEEQEGTDGQKTYTAKIDDQALKVEAKVDIAATLKMDSQELKPATEDKASYQSLSPDVGAWFTIDPRYNWLSPMLGTSDEPSAYLGQSSGYRKNFSSPHWIFQADGALTSGENTPSQVQQDYASAHSDLVPFSWGLAVEEIRYGYNDAGQLLLPAELAFLPVPCDHSAWSPNTSSYMTSSFSNYHTRVAQASFFRTLPVVDLNDGALDYTKYTKIASLLRGFGGENFPEEHRGIVNAFAAQDNYVLHQRLKQFALLGIPPTIKQAAYVTYQRLKATESVKRVASGMVNEDLKALKSLTPDVPLTSEEAKPKYDEFVTKYLFPLPSTSGGNYNRAKLWSGSQKLYENKTGTPTRPKTLDFIVQDDPNGSFADRLKAYNQTKGSADKLGQNDMTTLLAIAKESFGDRQQLFLFILRADAIAYNSARELSAHKPLSTARAVALVWRDAYGELPDRVVYYQFIP